MTPDNLFLLAFLMAVFFYLQATHRMPLRCNAEATMRAINTYYYRDVSYALDGFRQGIEYPSIESVCNDIHTPLIGNRKFDLRCISKGESCITEMLTAVGVGILGGVLDYVLTLLFFIYLVIYIICSHLTWR